MNKINEIPAAAHYLLVDLQTNEIVGSGYTPDGTLPAGAVPCSAAQAATPQEFALHNNTIVPAPEERRVAAAAVAKVAELAAAYWVANSQPVEFTTASGTRAAFDADVAARDNLKDMMAAHQAAQATPEGFFWVSADNTKVAPFSYGDMQALAAAIGARGWANFQHLQNLKDQLRGAQTVAAVEAIKW